MPIYEYRRPDGSTFEVVQPFSEDPLTTDPDTGDPVERVLHAPAVHFKGKGFYNTDYGTRKRQRESAASEGSSASSDSAGADSGKAGVDSASADSKAKPVGGGKGESKTSEKAGAKPVAAAK